MFSSACHHKSKFSPMSDIAGPQTPSGALLPGDLFQLLMVPSCPGLSFCPLGDRRGNSRPVSQMLHQNARMAPSPGPSRTTCSPLIQSGCAVLIGLEGQSLQLEKEWMRKVHLGKSSPWNKTGPQTSGLGGEGTGSGETFNWDLIKGCKRPFILAGGLGPGNITKAKKNGQGVTALGSRAR